MEFEFSWMAYFLSLFALMVCSIALTLLCPGAGKREDGVAHERGPDASDSAGEAAHSASQTADRSTLPAHPGDDA
ncbi:hypothetical protein [Paraburkholderia pallida]|uniref:Uncharacterized protein n=1 Tax=Paraburkholderia pallida TaxID=2547399 RepID=A0A4P7CKK2_9BURK|nr:hypothetical protein [Paraburkholderia pallida]QBQ96208.1 hypothetical protein E1956_02825 [Paraburkholderia pallida]